MLYEAILTFTEPLLGTVTGDEAVYSSYIAGKAPADVETDDELETLNDELEKGTTGFHWVEGRPVIYNYVIKGFFKDACSMLRRTEGTRSSKLKAYKKLIDGLVFIYPRRISLHLPQGETMGFLERPLRAQTAQGERVALARSEMAPAETVIRFNIKTLANSIDEPQLREWLDYGFDRGLGQWRNGGYGTFQYTLTAMPPSAPPLEE